MGRGSGIWGGLTGSKVGDGSGLMSMGLGNLRVWAG